jgi:nicotinate-nucleotide adenylyltransferase
MRIALFGGSFNPLHIGHITIAGYVLKNCDVDSLSFVLSPHNPWKNSDDLEEAAKRLRDLREAVAEINAYRLKKRENQINIRGGSIERLAGSNNADSTEKNRYRDTFIPMEVCDVEFILPQPIYTYNTLRYLFGKYPDNEYIWIIGADNAAFIEKWYRWREIVNEFEVWVYPRSGYDTKALCDKYKLKYLDAPVIDISSTEIRESIKAGNKINLRKEIESFCSIFD